MGYYDDYAKSKKTKSTYYNDYAKSVLPKNSGGFGAGIGYTFGKLGVGALGILEGTWDYTAGGLANLFGADDWAEERFSNNISGDLSAGLDNKFNPSKGWQVAGDVAGGVGNSLVGMAAVAGATLISGGTLTAPMASIIAGGTIGLGAAGMSTSEAYNKTGELGAKEFGYGALSGAAEFGLEALTGAAGKVSGRLFAKQTAKNLTKKSIIKGMVSSFKDEAIEEGLSEFLDPYFQRWTQVDPEAKNATAQEIGYAALIGGLSGALLGGLGDSANAIKHTSRGSQIAKAGKADSVVEIAKEFAEYQSENNTNIEALKYIRGLVTEYEKLSVMNTSEKATLRQCRLLGDIEEANTVLVYSDAIEESKKRIMADAKGFTDYLNSLNITLEDGEIFSITPEELLSNNEMLTRYAVSDALGHILMDSNTFYDAAMNGDSVAIENKWVGNQKAFHRFLETANDEEIKSISSLLDIDISKVTYEQFVERLNQVDKSKFSAHKDTIASMKTSQQTIGEAKAKHIDVAEITERAELHEGINLFKDSDGDLFTIIKKGTNYQVYSNGKITKVFKNKKELYAFVFGEEIKTQKKESVQKKADNKKVVDRKTTEKKETKTEAVSEDKTAKTAKAEVASESTSYVPKNDNATRDRVLSEFRALASEDSFYADVLKQLEGKSETEQRKLLTSLYHKAYNEHEQIVKDHIDKNKAYTAADDRRLADLGGQTSMLESLLLTYVTDSELAERTKAVEKVRKDMEKSVAEYEKAKEKAKQRAKSKENVEKPTEKVEVSKEDASQSVSETKKTENITIKELSAEAASEETATQTEEKVKPVEKKTEKPKKNNFAKRIDLVKARTKLVDYVLKSEGVKARPKMQGIFELDGKQCLCDGFFGVIFNNKIEGLKQAEYHGDPVRLDTIINKSKTTDKNKIVNINADALRETVPSKHSEYKSNIARLGNAYFQTAMLSRTIDALENPVCYVTGKESPLYIKADNGEAVVLPLRSPAKLDTVYEVDFANLSSEENEKIKTKIEQSDKKYKKEVEQRRKENEERRANIEKEDAEYLVNAKKELDESVATAENDFVGGKAVSNKEIKVYKDSRYDYREGSLLLELFDRNNITIPLKTRGWIKNQVSSVKRISEGKWYILYNKNASKSTVIGQYLESLYNKINNNVNTTTEAEDTATAADDTVKVTEEKTENVRKADKIDDFGEKIGGARKDLWGAEGLRAKDLDSMNEREAEKYATKEYVWKKPDYVKLAAGGKNKGILWAQNEIRKSLVASITYAYNSTPEQRSATRKKYVDTINKIQAMAESATTVQDFEKMGLDWLKTEGYVEIREGRLRYTKEYYDNPALSQSSYYETVSHLAKSSTALLERKAERAQFAVSAAEKLPSGYGVGQNTSSNGHTGDNKWCYGKNIYGSSYAIIGTGYDTREAAVQALKEYVSGKKKDGKQRFVPPQLAAVHRDGLDYRKDNTTNITGDDYLTTFGFKGGEFGNWVADKERQTCLNYGYDALMDLSDALGISRSGISLDGTLSIAFGSRGKGGSAAAAAHYEPLRKVINLTKMHGAGSLAHEWWHALDDYVARRLKITSGFTTEEIAKSYKTKEGKTYAAFKKLVDVMKYRTETSAEAEKRQEQIRARDLARVKYNLNNWFKWFEEGANSDNLNHYGLKKKPTDTDVKKYNDIVSAMVESGDIKYVSELDELHKSVYGRQIPRGGGRFASEYDIFSVVVNSLKTNSETKLGKNITDFYSDSRKMDEVCAKYGHDYWESEIEMSARAFACYISDVTSKGNDYLSGHSDNMSSVDNNGNTIYAYPRGDERVTINSAFDELFAALKDDSIMQTDNSSKPAEKARYALSESSLNNEQAKPKLLPRIKKEVADSFARKNINKYDELSELSKIEVRWTISSGKMYGVDDATIISLARITADSGISIGFADVKGDGVCYSVGNDTTIYLNKNGERTIETATLHELAHSLKGVEGYSYLTDKARAYYSSSDAAKAEANAIRARYKAFYEEKNLPFTEDIFEEEITAAYIEKQLSNRGLLSALAAEEPSFIQKCINRIKAIGKYFTSKSDVDEIQLLQNKFVSVYNMRKAAKMSNPADKNYALDMSKKQDKTSANTSINKNKLPVLYGKVAFEPNTVNLDIGGGRFDNVTDYLSGFGVSNHIYDPYNRSAEHNSRVARLTEEGRSDTVTISNVLNVIDSIEGRNQVLENAVDAVNPNGTVYISVYEGDGSGVSKTTGKDQFQLNRKTADYVSEVSKYFGKVVVRNKVIIATEPIKAVGSSIRYALPSDRSHIDLSTIEGSDLILTSMPTDKISLRDVAVGDKKVSELKNQVVGDTKKFTEGWQIMSTNAQAGLERVIKSSGMQNAMAETNYVRASRYAGFNAIHPDGGQYSLDGETRLGDSLVKIWEPIYEGEKRGKKYAKNPEANPKLAKYADYKAKFELYLSHYHNIDRYAQGKMVLGEDITSTVSMQRVNEFEEAYPEFRKTAEQLWKYSDNLLQLYVESGMYSQEYVDVLRNMYPHYVPTFRAEYNKGISAIQGKTAIQVNSGKKRAVGADTKILPIDDTIAKMTIQRYTSARINKLLVDMADSFESNGIKSDDFRILSSEDSEFDIDAGALVETKKTADSKYQVSFYKNGNRVTVEVSRNVYAGIESFVPSGDTSFNNVLLDGMSKVNTLFKKLVTSWNPFFSFFRNPIRDIQEAGLYTRYPLRTFTKNYGVARKEISSNGRYWQEAKAAGITAASVYDYERGITIKDASYAKKAAGVLESAGNALEMTPRLAEYICARESGLSVQEALLQAQDVTTNFGRGGTFAKKLNATVMPFLNPAIQGFSKMVRAYTGKDAAQSWVNLIIRSIMLGIGLTALNDLLNGDDDDYENLSSYIKENNYVFAVGDGDFIKIPKGRVLGVIGSVYLRSKWYLEGDENAFDGFLKNFATQVTPVDNFSRTIFSPISDLKNNTTWYGGTIESQKWANTQAKDRYDEGTSSISIWLGKVFNYSPIKIDYLLAQYGGVVADVVLPATTTQAEKGIVSQNFLANSITNSKWSTKFYDTIEKYNYAKTSGDATAKGVVKYLNSIKGTISDMNAQKREIQADTSLSDNEKLTQTRIIQAAINALEKDALENAEYLKTELGKYDLSEDGFDSSWRDAVSVVIGEDFALRSYNADVYAKATKLESFGIGLGTYYDYYFDTKTIKSDTDADGATISGSKKAKVIAYTWELDIPDIQKLVLIMSNGYTIADGDIKGIKSIEAKKAVATYISKLNITTAEKVEYAEMCGLTVRNGRIVIK